ncbi:MAG: hypothetical protein AAFN07_15020 [Pseudomonadota bacterium]
MRLRILILLLLCQAATAQSDWPELNGPYLGQTPPGMTPVVFAPDLVSLSDSRELNSVFSPKNKIFMFSRVIDGQFKMFFSSMSNDGTWSEPRMAGPSRTYPGHSDVDMTFSPDGDWLYFISTRPLPGYSLDRHNIWRSKISRYGLETPEPLGPEINGPDHELYPWLAADGSLYFSSTRADGDGSRDTYRAQYKDSAFEEPVNLGPAINTDNDEGDIFVSPDESFLIHVSSGREDSLGEGDLYISFRAPDGHWGDDIHLGDTINSELMDYCPVVSPDGKFFFFTRGDDIMWVDAKILDAFRPSS